jgi:hypothetical protein
MRVCFSRSAAQRRTLAPLRRNIPVVAALALLVTAALWFATRGDSGYPKTLPRLPQPPVLLSAHERDLEGAHTSQTDADALLRVIFGVLPGGEGSRTYAEFGAEDGSQTNSRMLRERRGWSGLLLDGGFEDARINLRRHFVTAENIAGLLERYGTPRNLDLLSVDVDFSTWHLLRALIGPSGKGGAPASFRPRVVIAEFNAAWPPPLDHVVPYNATAMWDCTDYFSASLSAFARLFGASNYTLVAVDHAGIDSFWVADELRPRDLFVGAGDLQRLYRPPSYHGRCTRGSATYVRVSGGHPEDELFRPGAPASPPRPLESSESLLQRDPSWW